MEQVSEVRATRGQRLKAKYVSMRFLAYMVSQILCYIFAIGICFVVLYPIITKVAASLKSLSEFYDSTVIFVPRVITFANWKSVWYSLDIFGATGFRTFILTTTLAVMQTMVCTLVGYGFARFNFKGNRLLFALVLFTLLVPPQVILIPLMQKFLDFNFLKITAADGTVIFPGLVGLFTGGQPVKLLDTYWPQIILAGTGMYWKNGIFIYMMRQYFRGVPTVLEEASYIDGAKSFKTFVRIMLPPALGMMLTVFLFSFCWQWMDITYTKTFLKDIRLLSTNVTIIGHDDEAMKLMLQNTAVLIMSAPLLLLYVVIQNFFVESIERSGITG